MPFVHAVRAERSSFRSMRRFALISAVGLLACAPAVAAAATIKVKPTTVHTGHKVRVHGNVSDCTSLPLLPPPSPPPHDFAGVPAISVAVASSGHSPRRVRIPAAPGTYKITGRCGGGNIG